MKHGIMQLLQLKKADGKFIGTWKFIANKKEIKPIPPKENMKKSPVDTSENDLLVVAIAMLMSLVVLVKTRRIK